MLNSLTRILLHASASALALIATREAPAQAVCSADQLVRTSFVPTGEFVPPIAVMGTAGSLDSGVLMKPGFTFRMTAAGSIRVGVLGETGTPPEGWMQQGVAGAGYPAANEATYSLLYKAGINGKWRALGSSAIIAKLDAGVGRATMFFGINDQKLSDNSGMFVVTLTELKIVEECVVAPPPSGYMPSMPGGRASTDKSRLRPSPPGLKVPCAGQTADGRRVAFQFPLYCGGNFSRNIPVEACTRAEALTEARAFAASAPLNCVLAE